MPARISRRDLGIALASTALAQDSEKAYTGPLDGTSLDPVRFDPVVWSRDRWEKARLELTFKAETRKQAEAVWMVVPHSLQMMSAKSPRSNGRSSPQHSASPKSECGRICSGGFTDNQSKSHPKCFVSARTVAREITKPNVPHTGEWSMPDPVLLHCSSCGTTNRVPVEKIGVGRKPVCGRCKSPLQVPEISHPIDVTDASFSLQIESAPLPVLLDMWAP